ncbi:hypothetical protein GALMADRAFT_235929 [Galerina marginata CBS 339.88]|uniref:Uncharacterized protein n=1 Tax=Galerina marginata (strain CBS 339.88) TaxID=685588 RepID=A0A067TKF5_GALM3|nr:hypothetical protein GALMADRAFT_235929 [Galerina marginata CBS 339.88]
MTYSTRNSFYLRISNTIVLPIYVYLDERHVDWMSDKVLQHVLSDLRPHILAKLKSEADSLTGGSLAHNKATVDTHRGDTYQFCYFIRKTEPHSVVIKSRTFRATPPQKGPELAIPSSKKRGKRREPDPPRAMKNKKRKINQESATDNEDEDFTMASDSDDGDTYVSQVQLEIEEEEEKPKPILGLRYQGFTIYGHCLCVVVEPWPVVRAMTVPPLFSSTTQSARSAAVVPRADAGVSARARTPLFLPDDSEQQTRPEGANTSHINQAYLQQILNEGPEASDDDEDDMGGMLEFSQVLRNVGDSRAGAINDDDDMDGSILFGDADEFREL